MLTKAKYEREGAGFSSCQKTHENLIKKWNNISLIKRIICGLIIGLILGLVVPQASVISILGTMFVRPLKALLASGILSGYERALPHEDWSEDQLKIYYRFVYGR